MSDLLDRLAPVDATYTLAKQATDLQLHQQSNTPLEARLAPVDLNAGPTTSATASWAATRRYRQAQGYRDLMNLAALDSQTDPARKAEEEAKIQVSMYLADRMQAEPKDVYLSWDSQGHSPIAEAYFKQTDLPISYRKRAANEIDRAAKTYQQLNLMSGQYFSGSFDPAVFAKWQALEDSKPPADVRERGAGHWLADIPLTFIQQAPYILDMGAGELAGGVLGGAIGTLIGPEGTAAGFAIGRRVGGAVEAARTGAAQIFQNIMTMPDPETGKPLYQVVKDPAQLASIARWAASVGGVLTAVPATVGMEAILGKAPEFFAQLGLKAIATEGQKGVFRSAFGQFLQKYGKNVGLQMMNMPVQNVVMQISQDASAADANTQLGTNLPLASLKEYGQLIAEGVNVGLQTGLPLSLFGSIREARGAMERITAAESRVKAQAELKSFETMADTARPAAERIAEIGATRADVQAKVDALKPQLDALDQVKDPKEVQRITKEYDAAATKLAVLDFLQKDAEASAPDAAWKNTRTQWQATQPAEALAPSSASPLLELDSPVVQTIKEGLPKLSDEQAQGAALYAKLLADRVGQNLDDYIGQRFVTGIFDATKAKELEAGGHWGAISWDEAGKAIFYTTEHSNFSTWTHELTHMFERDLTAEERVKVQQWLGIQPGQVWTDQQHEDFANAMMASMAKGIYPREDLRPVFDRYSSWINDIYHTARDSWNVSEDIRKNMEGLLASGRLKEPAAAVPAQTLFQTEAMHGTAYDFEQFDPGMIGEGEGGASFGWGFYQTSKEGVARYYADLVQKRRTWGEGDYPGDVGGPVQRGHVYRQVLKTEIQRDNFMRWYEQPSEEQRSQILRAAADEKIFADRENRGYLLERFKQAVKQGTGEDLYKNLSLSLGSDRKASEFLNRAGIDGIQYPVGTVIGGNTARDSSKGWNYVVFDAGNIAIKEKMLFQPAEEAANKVFDDGLRKFIGGQLRSDEVIPVGQAGDILKAAGLDGEIRLRQSILKKAEAKHGVKAADLQDLPGYLNHPMAIFPSIKTPGASTIVTELTIGGAPVVAGIEAKKLGSGVEVLDVLTVHRRDPEQVLFWLAKFGKTIQPKFVDPQKVTAWLNEQAPSYQGRSLTKPLESLNSISNVAQDLLRGKGKDVLFQTDPHEEEVRKAVDRGMPVPDQVLQEYADRPWAKQETADRARLMEDARKVLDEQQFIQWKMDQAGSDAKPEAYYKAVWDASRRTPENPDVTINRFRSAMDEKTVARVMRVLTSDEIEQELAAQNVDSDGQRSVRQEIDSTLTQQMKDLGRRSREGKVDSALAARVKAQLDADPLTWKQFLDDSLPKRSHERSAEAELAADPLPALTDEEKALTVGGLDEEIRTLGDQVTAERMSIAEAQTRIQQEARPRRSKLTPQVRRELDKRYIAELKKRHAKEIAELKKRGGLVETKELLRLRKMEQ